MSPPLSLAIAVAGAGLNAIAWAAFRVDKRAARRGKRRTPERTLMILAAFGPFGALVGMYLHAERHKVAKARFAIGVPAFATVQAAVGAFIALDAIGALGR